jgi:hypothetical protein
MSIKDITSVHMWSKQHEYKHKDGVIYKNGKALTANSVVRLLTDTD